MHEIRENEWPYKIQVSFTMYGLENPYFSYSELLNKGSSNLPAETI